MDTHEEDRALVKAALRRKRGAFDTLVIRHGDRIFNACCRFLGDEEEARDCAQETFVKAYRSLSSFRFEASFSTWLYAIAVNTCKNRLQSAEYRAGRRTIPLDPSPPGHAEGCAAEFPDPGPSSLEQLSRRERERLLQRAIEELPEGPRTLVVLRDIEGLSYEEVSRIMGMSLGTVKSGLARARGKLRQRLKGVR